MSLAYVKEGATGGGGNAAFLLDPQSGVIIGYNGQRMHAWEVEPAVQGGDPGRLDADFFGVKVIDYFDFGDKWKPLLIPPGFIVPFDTDGGRHIPDIYDWWNDLVVWRRTNSKDLKKTLSDQRPTKGDLWVLDASTPSFIVWPIEADEAYDVGVGEPREIPQTPLQQALVDGKFLLDALQGRKDQNVYVGWGFQSNYHGMEYMLVGIYFEDEPFWAMIMGMQP